MKKLIKKLINIRLDMEYILKNGNKPYDLTKHPICGANKRNGGICKGKAMKNGRCRLHGGLSTGAITQEGKIASAKANFKSGFYSKEVKEIKKILNEVSFANY
jgi:hypothetical protein